MSGHLIFVYKADSGLFHTLGIMLHKLLSPQTYECQLCALTHGVFREHPQWRAFIEQLDEEVVFLHRDEFSRRFPGQGVELPAVFREAPQGLEIVLSAPEVASAGNLEQLQRLLLKKLS